MFSVTGPSTRISYALASRSSTPTMSPVTVLYPMTRPSSCDPFFMVTLPLTSWPTFNL
ncbi:hypothetical protein D3C83_280170 [compost metagenome]